MPLTGVLEATLDAILECAAQGIIVSAENGAIVRANAMAQEMFGYDESELLARRIEDLMPARYRPVHVEHRGEFFQSPRSRPMGLGLDLTAVRKDGSEFPVEISLSSVQTPNGRLAVSLITDITERKQRDDRLRIANAKLERANAALEQFVYAAGHDFREPLRTIGAFTQLLERRYRDKLDEEANEYIGFITDGLQRLTRLLDLILEYSRIPEMDVGSMRASSRVALEQALSNLASRISDAGAAITSECDSIVAIAELHLTQVFQNLLANAMKYRSEETPRIRISESGGGDGWVTFCVSDNGSGIAPEDHERIFALFNRMHGPEYEGAGLGLAISKRIVELYGGRMWVDSKLGEGARFYFTLPAAR